MLKNNRGMRQHMQVSVKPSNQTQNNTERAKAAGDNIREQRAGEKCREWFAKSRAGPLQHVFKESDIRR